HIVFKGIDIRAVYVNDLALFRPLERERPGNGEEANLVVESRKREVDLASEDELGLLKHAIDFLVALDLLDEHPSFPVTTRHRGGPIPLEGGQVFLEGLFVRRCGESEREYHENDGYCLSHRKSLQ